MNYGTLKTSIADYTHRSDLTSYLAGFIDQARLRIGGDLRGLSNFTTATVTSFSNGLAALPTNLGKLVSVTDSTGMALQSIPLDQIEQFPSGVYAVAGSDLYVPGAGSATVVSLAYYSIPDALSGSTDVSVPMVEYPQLWIYASVAEAAIFIQDYELAASMNALYDQLILQANRAGNEARFAPGFGTVSDQTMYQSLSTL